MIGPQQSREQLTLAVIEVRDHLGGIDVVLRAQQAARAHHATLDAGT